jgi:hypothetical protein
MKAKLMYRQPFCTFDDFINFVRNYQYIGFHNKANHECIRKAYNALRGPAPFSRDARFPEDLYVHLTHPELNN